MTTFEIDDLATLRFIASPLLKISSKMKRLMFHNAVFADIFQIFRLIKEIHD